ncbi:MAG: transketolase [Alphaproteobacteria bacterium]|nr:MAG: transketolase [Alphaproteobacteria bacterium]
MCTKTLANAIRFLTVDAVEKAQSGHTGMPLGMADVATVLFKNHLKFYAKEPLWKHRDKLILSCGHGCMLQYTLLYLTGYEDITIEDIKNFRQLHSPCSGHPEYGLLKGIEVTTGPLGQGIGHAVGMALSDQHEGLDRHIYVMVSDGDLMEGIAHEAFALAKEHNLSKLIFLYDDNQSTIDGRTFIGRGIDKLMAYYEFNFQSIDGHDPEAIDHALTKARKGNVPQFIACKTIIGYGVKETEGKYAMHSDPVGQKLIDHMRERFNWPYTPFEIPEEILKQWRDIGAQYKDAFLLKPEYDRNYRSVYQNKEVQFTQEMMSTRDAFGALIKEYDVIGGSCDLGGSTRANKAKTYRAFGVREHGMGAALNGIVLSKTYRAFGTTFFVFSDYMRPAIRMAALMRVPTVFIYTHDSIGVGEDGPTHQPVEHLASLRAMPHLNVYRPCDANETQVCLQQAFEDIDKPSVIALTRQALPVIHKFPAFPEGELDFVFLATGSEVHLALEVATELELKHSVRVVSIPCVEKFHDFKALEGKKRIIIEAGCRQSWEKFLRPGDMFFGIEDFGHSAPYTDVYVEMGLTKNVILNAVKDLL